MAVAIAIDFVTLKYRIAIFEQFYQWWSKLSALNLETAGERGVRWFATRVNRIFGINVFSIRSILMGMCFVLGATCAVTTIQSYAVPEIVTTVLICAAVLVPGVINFLGGRLLLQVLDRRVNFIRVLLFGLASIIFAEITALVAYSSPGLGLSLFIRIAFSHHLALTDVVPVSAILLIIAYGVGAVYLPVAIFPAICCIFIWIAFVLLYLSSKLGVWVKHFLADRIEQKWKAPFSSIGAVIAALVTVILWLSDFVSPQEVVRYANTIQTVLQSASLRRGTQTATHVLIALSDKKPELASYYEEWAIGLRRFVATEPPTPEQVRTMLEVHLPNLIKQWSQTDHEYHP